jgi:GTPase
MSSPINKAILVHIDLPMQIGEDLDEFKELVKTAGGEIVELVTTKRSLPEPKYFIGSGKALEIQNLVLIHKPDLVIFNHNLSPSQERNLEKLFQCRVIDRTRLILDIFAKRARSFAGRLQVELAQLQYMSTRLVRGWTHLERQAGGIGLRGPGETQLEEDRRVLRERVKTIKKQLQRIQSHALQSKRARKRSEIPLISLIGYTNAGKSTLFNKLTKSDVYVADQLFATLDPTVRRINIPSVGNAIISDTVGFMRHLPDDLIDAFRATLEEICDASLLLHIVDISDPAWREKIKAVNIILKQINAEHIPQLLVYNKTDLLPDPKLEVIYGDNLAPYAVKISAIDSRGFDLLLNAIESLLQSSLETHKIILKPSEAKLRSFLYVHGNIIEEQIDSDGNYILDVKISKKNFQKLMNITSSYKTCL